MLTLAPSVPAAAPAAFPPPSVPLRFWDGDRYEWSTGDAWERRTEGWAPVPDDGSGYFTDDEVRHALAAAVESGSTEHRFVPLSPGAALPGQPVNSLLELYALRRTPTPTRHASQYLMARGGRLLAGRELIAEHHADIPPYFPATVPLWQMLHVVKTIMLDHPGAAVSWHRPSGRLYARYLRPEEPPRGGLVECLHVFVLTAADAAGGE
ncbi:hypothetical protein ACIQ9R_36215 [Streptomyces sp. NPDC094447]|uniref:hypothetical protein n=1 Tax=Streptomyces sp. NPDC094447 TaxID=3366062 RepID=UPI003801AAAF